MDPLTVTFVIIACYWIYSFFKKRLNYFEDLGVPYVPGWPVLGNFAPAMFRIKHMHQLSWDIYNCNKEAKYVGAFDFTRPAFMLRDSELIKSVTIKNFDHFPDHNNLIDVEVDPLFGGNLFNMVGDSWKETRNLLTPAFTSSKMKNMYELIVEVAKNFVSYMENLKDEDRKMIATKDLFTKFTNDVIATCAFGISVDTLKNPKNNFYVFGKDATTFEGIATTFKFFLARASPAVFKLLKLRLISERATNFFTNVVRTTIAARDEQGISRPDMLQLMMDARGKESKNLKLDTTEMTAQAFVFFLGGFDTTSTQMCVICHELAINPDIQSRLQEEIDEVLRDTGGKPTYERINGMPYLEAVFNESLRLHTQFAFIDRLCAKTFELPPALPGGKPITIKPGTNLWIPTSAIHRDPQYHEDPEKFNPERYYNKKVTINDVVNMGFGIGPRSCIGNRFATLEIKILLFFLLAKFNLRRTEKTRSPLTYSKASFTIKPDEGYWLAVEPRS